MRRRISAISLRPCALNCTLVQRRSSESATQLMSPASCMLCTIRVTDGGFICSASARSPSEGFFSFSTETSIEAWAGEMPPSDEWRRRRFSLVMARRNRAAVSFVVIISISSPN